MIAGSLNHKCCVLKPSICDLHINEKWVNSEPISLANSKEIIQENLCKYTKKSFSIFSFKKKKKQLLTLKPVLKVYYWSSLIPARCWGLKQSTTKLILEARDPRHQKKLFNTKTKPENPECTNVFSSSDFSLSQVCAKLWLTGMGYIPSDKEKTGSFMT